MEGTRIDEWATNRSANEIRAAVLEVIEALMHLHRHRIVHGDVKASNVLVAADGSVTLLDLGVARRTNEVVNGFKGTLGYAAPELLQGQAISAATDVYAVGALLYRCFTRRSPFSAPDPAALAYLPLVSLPLPPSSFDTRVSRKLDRVILRMLARSPERRPDNLKQVAEMLRRTTGAANPHPVMGMTDVRDELTRAVVGVADGEGRVVVVYGPPGCGRRTLIGEAVEAARREGLEYVAADDPAAFAAAAAAGKKPVTVVRTSGPWRELCSAIIKDNLAGLVLIHSERPQSELPRATLQLTPPPLTLTEAKTLATLRDVRSGRVDEWWSESMGSPMVFLGHVEAHRRGASPLDRSTLPAEARRLLSALEQVGEARISDLATALKLDEHSLLDWCELLMAHGVAEAGRGGITIRVTST